MHMTSYTQVMDDVFNKIIEELRQRFYAGKVEEKIFKYIGLKVEQSNIRLY